MKFLRRNYERQNSSSPPFRISFRSSHQELVNDMKSESVLPFEWNHCPQPWKSWAGQQANSLLKWRDCDRFCKFQQGPLALSTPAPQRTGLRKRVIPLECSDASHISGQKFHRKGKSGLHFGSLTRNTPHCDCSEQQVARVAKNVSKCVSQILLIVEPYRGISIKS